jgi:flavorubredoxin
MRSVSSAVTEIAPGRLYAMSSPFEIDGRVSWYPPEIRGASVINCYLLIEGDDALLVDTGLAVHAQDLLDALERLLPSSARLSVLYTRVGEYQSISNTPLIHARFPLETIYGAAPECSVWSDFGAEREWGVPSALGEVPSCVLRSSQEIELGGKGRTLLVANSVLRLLTNHWVYDSATATLFSGDVFTYGTKTAAEGPWVIDPTADRVSASDVRRHLVGTRYWWLDGADVEVIRQGLRSFFANHDVSTIAPGYGCLIRGEALVSRHVRLLDEALAGARRSSAGTKQGAQYDHVGGRG